MLVGRTDWQSTPVLPGPPLSYGGLLLLHFTERVEFTTTQLIVWFMLVLLTIAFDYLLPIWGVKNGMEADGAIGDVL